SFQKAVSFFLKELRDASPGRPVVAFHLAPGTPDVILDPPLRGPERFFYRFLEVLAGLVANDNFFPRNGDVEAQAARTLKVMTARSFHRHPAPHDSVIELIELPRPLL